MPSPFAAALNDPLIAVVAIVALLLGVYFLARPPRREVEAEVAEAPQPLTTEPETPAAAKPRVRLRRKKAAKPEEQAPAAAGPQWLQPGAPPSAAEEQGPAPAGTRWLQQGAPPSAPAEQAREEQPAVDEPPQEQAGAPQPAVDEPPRDTPGHGTIRFREEPPKGG